MKGMHYPLCGRTSLLPSKGRQNPECIAVGICLVIPVTGQVDRSRCYGFTLPLFVDLASARSMLGPILSDRQTNLSRGLELRPVHGCEPLNFLIVVKPQGGSQMRQIQRTGRRDGWRRSPSAEIQREIPKQKMLYVLIQPSQAILAIGYGYQPFPREAYQVPAGFQNEKNAGEKLRVSEFFLQVP